MGVGKVIGFGLIIASIMPQAAAAQDAPQNVLDAIREATVRDFLFRVPVSVDPECEVKADEVSAAVDGVFVRSRIENSFGGAPRAVYLKISVDCVPRTGNDIFMIRAVLQEPREHAVWEISWNYGTFGLGPKDYLLDAVKESAERVATDFILAHRE